MSNTIQQLNETISGTLRRIASGNLKTFAPFLSLLRLNGKPMNLDEHYQMLPMFKVRMPRKTVFMIARQLGKSTSICANSIIRSAFLPYFHTLMLQPRFDQIQRLNSTVLLPLLKGSPFGQFIPQEELRKFALKKFNSGSMILLEHAYTSPDRVRGTANVACVYVDEAQDVDHSFIPVVKETMSASRLWGFTIETGTPKTTDTTLGLEWASCSQAEWVIKCLHCGYLNLPHPDHDLKKMIGLHGCICAKCGKEVNPINGTYVHAHPELSGIAAGYHISQIIHPMHCLYETKWSDLLAKLNEYSEMMVYNEVFGWPYDNSVVPLTLQDLMTARNQAKWTSIADIPRALKKTYRCISVGLDFDGGGALSDSFTNIAVVGLKYNTDVLDCLYRERIEKGHKTAAVCRYIMTWVNALNPDFIAYDAGGAGFVYKEMLEQAGCPQERMIPYKYTSPGSGDVIKFHKGLRDDNSLYYSIDKSRSLAVIIESIKAGKVTLPWFDDKDTEFKTNTTLDLLALIECPTFTRANDPVYLIGRKPGIPDDFAHALNFACSAIWDKIRAYPILGRRYTTDSLDNKTIMPELELDENSWYNTYDDSIFREALEYGAAVYHNPGGFFDE